MAVYWIDPYIDAPIGGIHGTLDGTTRNGTYEYPFRATDVITSGTNVMVINGVTLASGDEVRLKGLPAYTDFLVASSSGTWFTTNYYTLRTNTYDANLTTKVANGVNAVFAFISPDTAALINDPIVLFTGTHTPTVGSNNIVTAYSGSGITGFLSAMYKNSGDANKLSLYLVDPQYYIANTYLNTGTAYFCHFGTNITVTDGWTSSTTRDGKTILIINHSVTTGRTLYLNGTSNNTGFTLFDCPSTYFCSNNTTTNSLSITYYLFGAGATTALYRGNTYTQKIGGFTSGSSSQSINYVGYYYSSSAGLATSCNDSEVNIHVGYYPYVMYERYGLNTVHTIQNMLVFNSTTFLSWSGAYPKTANVGSVLQYSGSAPVMLSNGTSPGTNLCTINLMSGAVYYCYSTGTSLFNQGLNPYNSIFTEGVGVENFTSSRLSPSKQITSTTGPLAVSMVTSFAVPYSYSVKLNPANWYDNILFRNLSGLGSTTDAYNVSSAISLHSLDCEGSNYKDSNHKIIFYNAQYFSTGTSTQVIDASAHFSLNSYDKKAVGFAMSTSSNAIHFYGMMYYNEPTKANALCFQSNANQAANTQYTKLIEVTVPTYTTEAVKVEIDLETTSDWNTNTAVYLYYKNASNALSLVTLKALSATAITAKTTFSATIANGNLSPEGVRHMQAQLRIYNGTTPSKKFYVHDVRAVLV